MDANRRRHRTCGPRTAGVERILARRNKMNDSYVFVWLQQLAVGFGKFKRPRQHLLRRHWNRDAGILQRSIQPRHMIPGTIRLMPECAGHLGERRAEHDAEIVDVQFRLRGWQEAIG